MREEKFTIVNEQGLHARPAGQIAKESRNYKSKITLTIPETGKKSDAKSLMGIMTLKAKKGTVTADGEDEDAVIERFGELIKTGFGED